jgi:hypothetical protein
MSECCASREGSRGNGGGQHSASLIQRQVSDEQRGEDHKSKFNRSVNIYRLSKCLDLMLYARKIQKIYR